MMRRHPSRSSGSALVTVLWALILISVLAMSLAERTQMEVESLRREKRQMASKALAEAGIEAALFMLSGNMALPEPLPGQPAPSFAQPPDKLDFPLSGGRAEVQLKDEGGKANVGLMGPTDLAAAFEVIGASQRDAEALGAAVADWLDPDDFVRLGGAERGDYEKMGAGTLPPNGPITDLESLLGVRGMTAELFYGQDPFGAAPNRVGAADILGIYGEATAPLVDPATVEARMLVGFAGMSEEEAEDFISRRQRHREENPGQPLPIQSLLAESLGLEAAGRMAMKWMASPTDLWAIESRGYPKDAEEAAPPVMAMALVRVRREPKTFKTIYEILHREIR
jgi:hypothetical protein